jgi:alkaline phosphatase D
MRDEVDDSPADADTFQKQQNHKKEKAMEFLRKSGPTSPIFSRRGFLTIAGATLVQTALAQDLTTQSGATRSYRFGGYPFTLGVASGDPEPDGIVLWTRLAPDPLNGGGMPQHPVYVDWEVATDSRMRRVVRHGVAAALPQLGHSVHVEVDGLQPSRWYWYRFSVGREESAIGRTRTAPLRRDDPRRLFATDYTKATLRCREFTPRFHGS